MLGSENTGASGRRGYIKTKMVSASGIFLFSSALKSSRKAQEELLYFK